MKNGRFLLSFVFPLQDGIKNNPTQQRYTRMERIEESEVNFPGLTLYKIRRNSDMIKYII